MGPFARTRRSGAGRPGPFAGAAILAPAIAVGAVVLAWALGARAAASADVPGAGMRSVVGDAMAAVTYDGLARHVCRLQDRDGDPAGPCNARGSRFSHDADGVREATGYVASELERAGLEPVLDPFDLPPGTGAPAATGVNVLATIPGAAPESERLIYVIGAHYDSTAANTIGWRSGDPSPGADDDASGVATVLEAARLLAPVRFHHTIRFALFGGEEQGSYGSMDAARASQASGEPVAGMIGLDMIGYDGDAEPRVELHAGSDPRSQALATEIAKVAADFGLPLVPQTLLQEAVGRSDHESYWRAGFPAVLLVEDTDVRGPTRDWNPHYHTTDDTLSALSPSYLAANAKAAVGAVTRLARPEAPDLQVTLHGPPTVRPGETVALEVRYANRGFALARGATLTQTLSAGLTVPPTGTDGARFTADGALAWSLGDIAPGAAASRMVVAAAALDGSAGPVASIAARIGAATLDADAVDNVAALSVLVGDAQRAYLPLLSRHW